MTHIHYDIASARKVMTEQMQGAHAKALANVSADMKPLIDAQYRLNRPSIEVTTVMMEMENEGLPQITMKNARIFAAAHYLRIILQLHADPERDAELLSHVLKLALLGPEGLGLDHTRTETVFHGERGGSA